MFTFTWGHRDTLLVKQIEVYIESERRRLPFGGTYLSTYQSYLQEFVRQSHIDDVHDITDRDIEQFIRHIQVRREGRHPVDQAKKAIMGLIRYYTARGKRKLIRVDELKMV